MSEQEQEFNTSLVSCFLIVILVSKMLHLSKQELNFFQWWFSRFSFLSLASVLLYCCSCQQNAPLGDTVQVSPQLVSVEMRARKILAHCDKVFDSPLVSLCSCLAVMQTYGYKTVMNMDSEAFFWLLLTSPVIIIIGCAALSFSLSLSLSLPVHSHVFVCVSVCLPM